MDRNRYAAPGKPGQDGEVDLLGLWAKRAIYAFLLAFILYIVWLVLREKWRAENLLGFCKVAKPGISFQEMLALEDQYSIDDSYLVQAHFEDYIDQEHSRSLEFRSHMLDPDFACDVGHDGKQVKHVQLLTLEGFDPN